MVFGGSGFGVASCGLTTSMVMLVLVVETTSVAVVVQVNHGLADDSAADGIFVCGVRTVEQLAVVFLPFDDRLLRSCRGIW